MKMIYGGTPVNSMKVKHYELNTNGATAINSAVQAGLTYFANGKKEVGTGKSFEFARYGEFYTNNSDYIPTSINTILISSSDVPLQFVGSLYEIKNRDFTTSTQIGSVLVDNVFYPVSVTVSGNFISITCEKTILLQVFFGKDNYV